MQLKVSEIISINNTLKNIIDTQKDIDALFKFKLLGIMKEFEPCIANFDLIQNEKVIEYGEKNEDDRYFISKDSESYDKFISEIDSILTNEVDINIKLLSANEVFKQNIPSNYLLKLYDIMEEK